MSLCINRLLYLNEPPKCAIASTMVRTHRAWVIFKNLHCTAANILMTANQTKKRPDLPIYKCRMHLSFSMTYKKLCDKTWRTFAGLLKIPSCWSFPYHQARSWPKQAGNICTFVPCFSSTSDSESQKGTREECVGTCECKVQEARVVPWHEEVLVCHVLLQSQAHRLNTSKRCVHLVSEFSNGQKIKGGVCNLEFKFLFSSTAEEQ